MKKIWEIIKIYQQIPIRKFIIYCNVLIAVVGIVNVARYFLKG